MTRTLQPADLGSVIADLDSRVKKLENVGTPGTMAWTDQASGQKIVIGTLPDGSFGVQIGNVTIKAVAGTISAGGNVTTGGSITASGNVNTHAINTSGQNIQISVSGTAIYFNTV